MKCKDHPNYKAIRTPRVDCPACWDMYNTLSGGDSSHGKAQIQQPFKGAKNMHSMDRKFKSSGRGHR